MHDDRLITEARIDRFFRERLTPAVYRRTLPLRAERWDAPGEPVPFGNALAQDFRPAASGEEWGPAWGTMWLHLTGRIPPGWGGPGTDLEVLVDLGYTDQQPGFQCEGLVWLRDGGIVKALNPRNQYIPVSALAAGPEAAAGREDVDFYVEAAANPDLAQDWRFEPTRLGDKTTAGEAPLYRLGALVIAERDTTVWELVQDVWAIRGLMHELPDNRPRRHLILRALERMLDVMDPHDVASTAAAGRAALAGVLASPAEASAHRIVATGHAHIDSAWLWPLRETQRKCARTFSNVVALMDRDPDLTFACSSAQQLAWIRDGYPQLFERIKEKAAEGRFVPVGGMWVEADTNMPGGEAMARQFVEGKRFFLAEFGVECEEAWLPDSFGYSAALPQIVRAAGSRWFLTQKLSWNQANRFPHHSFFWEGIDGSLVFTHFPPADTYSSDLSASNLAHAERTFREHGRASVSLVPFGFGDGGGGPMREMMAAARRYADLEGSPRVRVGTPREFFLEAEAEYTSAPVWTGEMYLEKHRGTYTAQARTKAGNRRSEHLLREAELWCSTAAVRFGMPYPADELHRLWRLTLLQQFHDILPGSSIAWVHRDAERNYAAIERDLEVLIGSAAKALVGTGERDIFLNAAPHARGGVPALGGGAVVRGPEDDARGEARLEPRAAGGWVLDNGVVRAEIDGDGLLVALVDAATGRNAIAPGSFGNLLELHRDTPNEWDAWDLDEFYRHNVVQLTGAVRVAPAAAAPHGEGSGVQGVAVLEVERAFGESSVRQRLVLEAGAAGLRIETDVDWHERQKLLKLGFGLDLRADRSASETQFGHVFRPVPVTTSWDAARFEICAHRWIHVAEPGYGVAIANCTAYGHDVTRTVRTGERPAGASGEWAKGDGGTTTTVRLSLLKAPLYPDPTADEGAHSFAVVVVPNAGIPDAVREGYNANLPARTVRGGRGIEPLVTVDHPGAVVEAVKLAEDGSGDVIVRLYESLGARTRASVRAGFDCAGVEAVDLLERPLRGSVPTPIESGDEGVASLRLRPFELVTLRLRRA
ncbi:glycoside hydrolase family 38 C-terminal domain-containing protein [Sinomonas sp. ASV486]|uniref:alpha-mannosidase n=1 Tax=Sinomonas sp. ASV486 TaxID=3051170 RepID=UPI0027DE12C7|nr:glycoside hydrolase family 38 C-terminal domain-containing protein [Sinomonas sp. ASV486]MDQ4490900.1 glycoside hydrolase family 38 C-terminal domain-containing protein [Sinomonas sp. ASV486]